MKEIKAQVKSAVDSAKEFRSLLDEIKSMPLEDRTKLRTVLSIIEDELTFEASSTKTKVKNHLWHGFIGLLTIGMDFSLQGLAHQTTGPEANMQIRVKRIEDLRRALQE